MIEVSSADEEKIYNLAEQLTGSCQKGKFKKNIIVTNVQKRIDAKKLSSVDEYLKLVETDKLEHAEFISALTIHTTSWFREKPHFDLLATFLRDKKFPDSMHACISACSTGEEAYTLAFVLEFYRKFVNKNFEYRITALDIDPKSVQTGKLGNYKLEYMNSIPKEFKPFIEQVTNIAGQKEFTVIKDIKKRMTFAVADLTKFNESEKNKYDIIFCRNVLIYFDAASITKIISKFKMALQDHGMLFWGHSEGIQNNFIGFKSVGHSIYERKSIDKVVTAAVGVKSQRTSTLTISERLKSISDKSEKKLVVPLKKIAEPVKLVSSAIKSHANILVLSKNKNFLKEFDDNFKSSFIYNLFSDLSFEKVYKPEQLKLVIVDCSYIKQAPFDIFSYFKNKFNAPVCMINYGTYKDAEVLNLLDKGLSLFFDAAQFNQNKTALIDSIKTFLVENSKVINLIKHKNLNLNYVPDVILLGASTGGTQTLAKFLTGFPKDCPPIVIVQHISQNFYEAFAKRLSNATGLKLGEFRAATVLQRGTVYLATKPIHIGIKERDKRLELVTSDSSPFGIHKPSVDFLFRSALEVKNFKIVAAIFTGMGQDGSKALKMLKDKGVFTFAQDEKSCVVYGMPKVAKELGGVSFEGNPQDIKSHLLKNLVKIAA